MSKEWAPKFKKGDTIVVDWTDAREVYFIDGVRSSKHSGFKHYLVRQLGLLSGEHRTYFKKPYSYVFDHRSRLITKEEMTILKSDRKAAP